MKTYLTTNDTGIDANKFDNPTGLVTWDNTQKAAFFPGTSGNDGNAANNTHPYLRIKDNPFAEVNPSTGFTFSLEFKAYKNAKTSNGTSSDPVRNGTRDWARLIEVNNGSTDNPIIQEGNEKLFAVCVSRGVNNRSGDNRYFCPIFGSIMDRTEGTINQRRILVNNGNTDMTTVFWADSDPNNIDDTWHQLSLVVAPTEVEGQATVTTYIDGKVWATSPNLYNANNDNFSKPGGGNYTAPEIINDVLTNIQNFGNILIGRDGYAEDNAFCGYIRNIQIVSSGTVTTIKSQDLSHGKLMATIAGATQEVTGAGIVIGRNTSVTISGVPDTGYKMSTMTLKGTSDTEVVSSTASTRTYTFTTSEDLYTFTASFPELDRTIQYETNGERITGMPSNQSFKYFTGDLTISGTTPVHPNGYGFLGWTTDKNALSVEYTKNQVIAADGTSTPTSVRGQFSSLADANGVIKLYPVWQKPLYELTANMDLVDTWTIPTVIPITIDLKGHTIRQTAEGKRVITVPAGATLTIIDTSEGGNGSITGGSPATENGGGIYVASTATLNLNGGHITGNKATLGGGVYCDGTLNIAGKVKVTGNTLTDGTTASNLYLPTDKKANVTAALSEGTSIGVTMQTAGTFTTGIADNATAITYLGYFTSDDATKAVQLDNAGNLKIDVPPVAYLYSEAACTTLKGQYTTLQAAINAAVTGEGVKLVSNVTESVTISTAGKSITLDLNDKMLKATDNHRVIDLTAGTLTITDNATTKTTRYWKKNANNYWEDPQTSTDGDHPEAYKTVGGCITGGISDGGSGIRFNGSNIMLIINGGNVVGNYTESAGGGIAVGESGANATITGSAVICGNAAKYGGGIRIYQGQLSVTNGSKIQYNNCSGNDTNKGSGGGLSVAAGTLKLEGNVTIKENTCTSTSTAVASNLWLNSNLKVTITGALNASSTNSDIGVTLINTTGTFTSGYKTYNDGVDPTTYFHSDIADPITVLYELDDSNEAQIYRYSGDDGNIHWAYDRNATPKTLTISKKDGVSDNVQMPNYMYNRNSSTSSGNTQKMPWLPFHSVIGKLVVETGVTTIGDGCCGDRDKHFDHLSCVEIKGSITKIGKCAFRYCSLLTTMTLPSSLTTIDDYAFSMSGLQSLVVPAGVTNINQYAFYYSSSLETLVLMNTSATLTKLGSSAFGNTHADLKIYVPNSKVSSYKGASNWKTYSGKIKGWTYRLSGGTSGNATLTLSSTSEMYTGSAIEPTALSLKINANAAVPIFNTEATPAQIESVTYKFSETAATEVVSTNYTLTYTDDHTNVGTKTATATAVDGKDYSFDSSNPVKLDYEITKRPITITVGNVDTPVEWKASYPSSDFSTDLLTVTESTLASGHSYKSANITASATVEAPATKRPLIVSDVVIKDGSNNDVTSNYEVTCVPGSLSEKVTVNVAAGWNTFWHPASLVKPAPVKPYIVTNVTTGGVAAEEQTYIQGDTPYLLNNSGSAGNVEFEVIYNQPTITGMDSKFKKSEGVSASSSKNYYVLKGSGFVWARSETIPSGKCYLDLSDNPALSRGFLDIIIGGGDGTTGIEGSEFQYDDEDDGNVWYDMSGRRLDGKPSKKRLYIKNGKKVVIK